MLEMQCKRLLLIDECVSGGATWYNHSSVFSTSYGLRGALHYLSRSPSSSFYIVMHLSHGADATAVTITAGKQTIKCPTQMFINNKFVSSSSGATYPTVNPSTDEVCLLHRRK
jgi:hypothetical protein